MTAFKAEYVDKKYVKTRLAYQLVFEVPAEQIDEADAVLGNLKGKQIWAAIARLKEPAEREAGESEQPPATSAILKDMGKQLVQRAALLAKDKRFWEWVPNRLGNTDEDIARNYILYRCDIESRAELATNHEAQRKFLDLEQQYRAERGK